MASDGVKVSAPVLLATVKCYSSRYATRVDFLILSAFVCHTGTKITVMVFSLNICEALNFGELKVFN